MITKDMISNNFNKLVGSFLYKANNDDAKGEVLNRASPHLDKATSYIGLLVFSSGEVNTIKP